jgi:hypothetical protein
METLQRDSVKIDLIGSPTFTPIGGEMSKIVDEVKFATHIATEGDRFRPDHDQ